MTYDFVKIEKKWQGEWEKARVFSAKDKGNPFYVLEMYPYPSGSGLHIGHAFNYTIGDIFARFKRMNGFNVLHPMGFDSFGLPAENAAIKTKSHPKIFTDKAIENYIFQQKALGLTYDWSRKLQSHDPDYYKWNQYFFIKLFEKGLVYRKNAPVNWCSKCDTVLANEQVHNGFCWRHTDTEVEIKNLEQWFIKTTDYADELLEKTDSLDWPNRIKVMQKNWIGKSEGSEVDFIVDGKKWPVFTTRADTLMGVTFLVVSAQHSRLNELVTKEQKKEVDKFLKKIKSTKQEDMDKLDKEGVFTGSYALHPITDEKIPIWAGNFVIADYGSGMVMAVPAHDQRDFEFAKKYKIKIKEVVKGGDISKKAFTDYGILVNSGDFDGLNSDEAKIHITKFLESKKLGKFTVNYKLRDWLVSRQRYWGTPIPMVYCDKCGVVPVAEKDLPVLHPEKVKLGEGNALANSKEFVNTTCPKCKSKARRETDTMDTFFDSSWYFLRFTDAKNSKKPFDKKNANFWMPVDFYTGGAEHACMHLIYARFFTKALRDLGFVDCDEPFTRLYNQGMVHGSDGVVMSKSRGNVVDPMDMTKKYGADSLRMFLVSMASPDKDSVWSEQGIESMFKFLNRFYDYANNVKLGKSSKKVESKVNKAIKEITNEINSLAYNIAIIKIRELIDYLREEEISKKDFEIVLKLISPFAPHVTEELWKKIGGKNFISLEKWPVADDKKIDLNIEKQEKAIDSLVSDINHVKEIVSGKSKVYVYVVPPEKKLLLESLGEIKKRTGLDVEVFAVNDAGKYDPEDKAKKAKMGRASIYLE